MIDWASMAGPGWRGWLLAGGLSAALHAGLLWSGAAETASTPRSRIAQQISISLIQQSEQRIASAAPALEAPPPAPSPRPTDVTAKAREPAPRPVQRRTRPAPQPRPSVRHVQHDRDTSANQQASAGQPTPRLREADFSADYLNNPLPRYPNAARRRGQQGLVLLHVEVLATGRCGRIGILHGSGHRMLDDAAVEAVKRWRFIPAARAGIPVDHWVQVPIHFRLSQAADDR